MATNLADGGGGVLYASWDNTGYGNRIIVNHGRNRLTLYGHLSEISVESGQIVTQGSIIGKMGSTGRSTGDHLHFEVIAKMALSCGRVNPVFLVTSRNKIPFPVPDPSRKL